MESVNKSNAELIRCILLSKTSFCLNMMTRVKISSFRILDKRIANEFIFLKPQRATFGQYDGQALHFPTAARPLKRLIRFRAIVNRQTALERGYMKLKTINIWWMLMIWPQEQKLILNSSLNGTPRFLATRIQRQNSLINLAVFQFIF